VERHDGKLDILHWSEQPGILASEPAQPAPEFSGGQRPVIDVLSPAFIESINATPK
jgi:hypothetical protein